MRLRRRRLYFARTPAPDSDVVEPPVVATWMISHNGVRVGELLHASRNRTQEFLDEAARLIEHVGPARMLIDPLIEIAVAVQLHDVTFHVGATVWLNHFNHSRAAFDSNLLRLLLWRRR